MLRRLSVHAERFVLAPPRFTYSLISHRSIAAAAVTFETNEKLVQNLALVLDNNPKAASDIGQAIGSESAGRVRKVLEQQNRESPFPPTRHQLRMVALAASIPYFGFGVLDNALMITLGEMIDLTLCAKFSLSTMVAAGLGNAFSDAVGVYSGAAVEDLAERYGFEAPRLTRAQEAMPTTKTFERFGQLFGVVFGCLVGMFPLLFMDAKCAEDLKKKKILDDMYKVVSDDVAKLLNCEAAMIHLIDHEKGEMYPLLTSGKETEGFRSPVGVGASAVVAKTGQFLNISETQNGFESYRLDFWMWYHFGCDIKVQSILYWPIFGIDPVDGCDKVVGILQVINKRGVDAAFTKEDEDLCAALSTHISASLATAHGLENGFQRSLENWARTMRMQGPRPNAAEDQQIKNPRVNISHQLREERLSKEDSSEEKFGIGGSIIDLVRNAGEQVVMGQAN